MQSLHTQDRGRRSCRVGPLIGLFVHITHPTWRPLVPERWCVDSGAAKKPWSGDCVGKLYSLSHNGRTRGGSERAGGIKGRACPPLRNLTIKAGKGRTTFYFILEMIPRLRRHYRTFRRKCCWGGHRELTVHGRLDDDTLNLTTNFFTWKYMKRKNFDRAF